MYDLKVYKVGVEVYQGTEVSGKNSDSKKELEDLVNEYKDDDGNMYRVVIGESGWVGEINQGEVLNAREKYGYADYDQVLKLNKSIEELY
ncbi:hypothetical protein ACWKSJ_02430 [Staphylococcus equorum]|uniref:hypothetical protein n=1 Tax=Staphylococcus saprophyticus TaxID=29385 RepID=UPI000852B4B8|nr:hypothetical protein [Staphylococcus saprophyticus]OEK73536.1 hypothetical protein AST06_07995 [Staphylococcus saprophyticus]